MGKPKEKPKVALPAPDAVEGAKPLVEKIARAKARLAKVAAAGNAERERAAKKRVKRAQRRLREVLKYDVARAKPAAPGEASAEAPAT